jgi:phenylalanyl-tRNA synthetase beta chain
MKGDVEAILKSFHVEASETTDEPPKYYHPGRTVRFGDVAIAGELHPDYSATLKPRQRVYLAELDVDRILRSRGKREAKPVPRYPSIPRDLSLLFDRTVQYHQVRSAIAEANIAELIRVEPFDRLDKGSFPESKYSLSISLIYQSPERTLTDAEIEGYDRRIIELLERRLGAQLRK